MYGRLCCFIKNILSFQRLILNEKHHLTKTIYHEFIIVYHRRYTHHRMGIGRICLFSRRADTRTIGYCDHRHHFRIAATTNDYINNMKRKKKAANTAFFIYFCPSENQFPESSLNNASKP